MLTQVLAGQTAGYARARREHASAQVDGIGNLANGATEREAEEPGAELQAGKL